MSTAVTYLAEARNRSNLTIRPDTMVDSVECAGTLAIGIRPRLRISPSSSVRPLFVVRKRDSFASMQREPGRRRRAAS